MINTAVDSRCYELHEHIDADRFQLLYHSEVKWLSRGLVLKLWFELKNEVFTFLIEKKKSALVHYYANTKVTAKFVYLCDIFSQQNQLISLQGRNSNKVLTFKRKLALWTKRSQEKRRDRFPLLYDILEPPTPGKYQ